MTTLKSCLKLLVGYSYERSGIDSMGNGPGMRAAIIAAYFYNDRANMLRYLKASTYITHRSEVVLDACISMSNLISYMLTFNAYPTINHLKDVLSMDVSTALWREQIDKIHQALEQEMDTSEYFKLVNIREKAGISGYIIHSMPYSIYCVLRYQNVQTCFSKTIEAGGDTDSTCAVVGAMLGSIEKVEEFQPLTRTITDIPYNPQLCHELALQLERKFKDNRMVFKPKFNYVLQLTRNLIALSFILVHALGRIRPKSWY